MPKQTLLGQVLSDQQRFADFSETDRLYSSREVGSAGGVSPGSNFKVDAREATIRSKR
jgi:hypothetical protein